MNPCHKCLEVEPNDEPMDECLCASPACPPWCSECLANAGTFSCCDTCGYWHPKDDLTTLDNSLRVCEGCIPGDIDDIHPPFPR